MELLIKSARIVDHNSDFTGDIYIKDGIISEIGLDLKKDVETIDAKGLTLMPAFVDLHVHFRDPGLTHKEDIETGSKAAVKGGYTTVNLMGNTMPICSDLETVNYVVNKGKEIGLVDIHQCMSITKGLLGKDLSHLDELKENNKDRLVKFITDDGKGVASNDMMFKGMNKAKELNLTIMSHAESPDLSAIDMRLAEDVMTARDILLSQYTGCRLHMSHVSTVDSMQSIIDAKKKGLNVTCEVAPHHIALTDDVSTYRVNPPIRKKADVDFMIKAIKDGYVDAIATDHAPHTKEDKEKGAPGISGIETSFSISYSTLVKGGHITLNKLSEIMSLRPAKIMELNKGQVQIGFDADLVLVDLEKEYTIDSESFASKGKNSPFNGFNTTGEVVCTLKKGKVVYKK